jgi:hypothetical protein
METGRRLRIRKPPVEAEPSAKMESMEFEVGQIVTYFSPKTFHPDSLQYATYYYRVLCRENSWVESEKIWLHTYTLELIHPRSANVPRLLRAIPGEIAAVEAYQLRIAMERVEREYSMAIDALHEMLSVVEGPGYYEPTDEYENESTEGYEHTTGNGDSESRPSIYEVLRRNSDMPQYGLENPPRFVGRGVDFSDTRHRTVADNMVSTAEEMYRPIPLTDAAFMAAADRMLDILIASHTRETPSPLPSATGTTPDIDDED